MGYDGFVTPTPKGTGLLTVSALLQNVVESQYRKME
jgi:5,10-methylene-tetrahydrofolate dehydrogenase/methenyl tetrahydrofolate cyclohydrolase